MNIRIIQSIILILSTAQCIKAGENTKFINGDNPQDTLQEKVFFEVTNLWNKTTQAPDQKFHEIFTTIHGANPEKPIAYVKIKNDGKYELTAIDDGRGPVFLGTIPQPYGLRWVDWMKGNTTNQYQEIRRYKNLPHNTVILNVIYNTKYEKNRVGVLKLAQDDGNVELFAHETRDTYAPSPEKLLEMIKRAKERKPGIILYINCKAGKGRSASGNAAYIFDILENAEIRVEETGHTLKKAEEPSNISIDDSFEMINTFLKMKRSVVNINQKQKPILLSTFEMIRKNKQKSTVQPPVAQPRIPVTSDIEKPAAVNVKVSTKPQATNLINAESSASVISDLTTETLAPNEILKNTNVTNGTPLVPPVTSDKPLSLDEHTPNNKDTRKKKEKIHNKSQDYRVISFFKGLYNRIRGITPTNTKQSPVSHTGMLGWLWYWLGY